MEPSRSSKNHPPWGIRACWTFLLMIACGGCAAIPCACRLPHVSAALAERMGQELGPPTCPGQLVLPNGADPADGLTDEEAIVIALWNNALFHEQLTELDIAYGDLVQAGLLPNPEILYFFPVTDKPYKYALELPLEAFWLRPIRVAAAERETARVCERLTQAALDLIRDVRQAYADVLLAEGRWRVAKDTASVRKKIAQLAQVRLEAGDISVQEATTARIDALRLEQEALRAEFDIAFAQERLRNLMGLGDDRPPLQLEAYPPTPNLELDADELALEATGSRPDALAAAQNAAAAAERARLARLSWFRFVGFLDASSGRRTGHELGPAFRMTIPLFQTNQGGIARADAEWERAERQRITLRNQILMEVHQAHVRYLQTRKEMEFLEINILPQVDTSIRRAETAYREGETTYLFVLEATRQLVDSQLRREQLRADLQSAWIELERSTGRRLAVGQPPVEVLDHPP